jgi:DNA invertase Pin-like site-specific DNA recombinase
MASPRAAVYLRVSSKDGRQDEANQEPDCARLCAARGWDPVFFRERESGAKLRPEWRRVIEAARLGHVGAVVFWSLDRTGRNRIEVCRDIEMIGHYGVVVASVKEPWLEQPIGPIRDILLQVMAWVAEGERVRLIERTRAGLARARQLGKTLGRPKKPHLAMAQAIGEVNDGRPLATVARHYKIPRASLRRAMGTLGVAIKGGSS